MTGPNGKSGMGWRLRALLLGSLALNLAVVGGVAGMMLLHPGREPGPGQRGRDFVHPYTRALEKDQRRALGRQLREDFRRERAEHGRGEWPDFLSGYDEALARLRDEPFDRAAFGAALEEQGARAEERQRAGQRRLAEFVAGLPPEERAAYADRLEAQIEEMRLHLRELRRDHEGS